MWAALALFAIAAAQPELTGNYEAHQMELAGALELQPNGHFRYALDYGAVSEGAEGDWMVDGATVRLTSKAAPIDTERSQAVFQGQPLARADDLLLLERYETVIRFERIRPEEQ